MSKFYKYFIQIVSDHNSTSSWNLSVLSTALNRSWSEAKTRLWHKRRIPMRKVGKQRFSKEIQSNEPSFVRMVFCRISRHQVARRYNETMLRDCQWLDLKINERNSHNSQSSTPSFRHFAYNHYLYSSHSWE